MKKIILLPVALIALIWFMIIFGPFGGWDDAEKTGKDIIAEQKQDFFIETQKFGDFSKNAKIKKIWKITWSQDISMTPNVAGRVTNIYVKAGDNVELGQRLVALSDNISNYAINVSRSWNAIERAQINYDSQKISLDKQVLDAQINVDKLESNLEALKQTSNKNLEKAKNDVDNIDLEQQWSKASLDVEKLDNNIERLQIEYNNLLVGDSERLNGLQWNLQNFFNSYTTLVADISQFGDELFWISVLNRQENDSFEDFLWANDINQRSASERQVRDMMQVLSSENYLTQRSKITESEMTPEQVLESVVYVTDGYDDIELLLNNLESTLNKSLRSVGTLWDSEIAAYTAQINGYQSQYQGSQSALISFETSSNTFLNTYLASQQSVFKQVELAKKDREILIESSANNSENALINFENVVTSQADQIKNLETQLKNAKNQLTNTQQNREITLRGAANSINDANINYSEANKNFNKLFITAPVSGTIGDLFIDVGQEVSAGTNMLKLISNWEKEIALWFSKDEVWFIEIWDEVFLESLGQQYSWQILSLSSVADNNFNYRATVWFNNELKLLWDLVTVYTLAENPYMLLPVNIIEVVRPGIGFVKIYNEGKIENLEVKLWKIWWEEIEIINGVQAWDDVITNSVSNYNPNKFELKLK